MEMRAGRHRYVVEGSVYLALVSAALMVGACGFDHSTNVLTPTSIIMNTSGSSAAGGALVGVWSSNARPTLPTGSTCGNFHYQIASPTPSSIAGTFTGECGGRISITGDADWPRSRTERPQTGARPGNGTRAPH